MPEYRNYNRRVLELRGIKDTLGPVIAETIQAPDIVSAHYLLGRMLQPQIHRLAEERINNFSQQTYEESGKVLKFLNGKITELESIFPELSNAVSLYLSSLEAWAKGAGLDSNAEKKDLDTLQLAMTLQNDEAGCQTLAVRGKNGEVYFAHTEEETDEKRIDRPRWITFITGQEIRKSFVYPDLLPGPAFGVSDNMVMMCDFIRNKRVLHEEGSSLANVIAWIKWYAGKKISVDEIIRYMSPVSDSLGITTVYGKSGEIFAESSEFSGIYCHTDRLGAFPHENFARASNIFSNNGMAEFHNPDGNSEPSRSRVRRMRNMIGWIAKLDSGIDTAWVRRILSTTTGGNEWSLASRNCRAHIFGKFEDGRIEFYIGSGPSVLGNEEYGEIILDA